MKKLIYLLSLFAVMAGAEVQAARKEVLDARIEEAIESLGKETTAGAKLAEKAEGMLVFPSVGKAGFLVGGGYGEGALLVNGEIVQYYRTATASLGLQAGVQRRSEIILFLTEDSLRNFRASNGWEIGVDGSVAIANIGAGGEIDTKTLNEPVVAFIFSNKGLMANLSLEGSKITKIEKDK